MILLLLSIQCAVNAYIYCEVLIKEGHLLHPYFSYLEKLLTKQIIKEYPDKAPDEVKRMPGYKQVIRKTVEYKTHWILKPLGGCALCTAGQMALWGFLAINFLPDISLRGYLVARTAWYGITTICTAILLVLILQTVIAIWQKAKQ